MSVKTNRQKVQELVEAFEAEGGLNRIEGFLSDNLIWRTEDHLFGRDEDDIKALQDDIPFIGKYVGKKAVLTMLSKLKANFGETRMEKPQIVGGANDLKQVVYDDHAEVSYHKPGEEHPYVFTSPFALVITFDHEGIIIYVELLYDTFTMTRRFRNAVAFAQQPTVHEEVEEMDSDSDQEFNQ